MRAKLFTTRGWPTFGYVNEQLAPTAPASQRDEDHVGHKVQVGNDRPVIQGDDGQCAASVIAGEQDIFAMHENWFASIFQRSRPGSGASQLRDFQVLGYFLVLDPIRYFDPSQPDNVGHVIDLCYAGARGFQCDLVRRMTDRNGGQRIAWDDPRSPFRGAFRLFAPGTLIIENQGPSTIYTDAYGLRFSTEPFPGAIEQYIFGNRASSREQGFIRGDVVNYASDPADGIRAPN